MITLGVLQRLTLQRFTPHGAFLRSEHDDEILLPNAYVTDAMHEGESIEVFCYTDSEDRPVATTLRPKAMLGEVAWMRVVDTTRFGAFVDWGLPKDLFIPRAYQKKEPLRVGEYHWVRVVMDEQTHRLAGSVRLGFESAPRTYTAQKHAQLKILAKTPLGYKVLVDERYEGMIFHNEIFGAVHVGEVHQGYIKQRRQDGKLDCTLRPIARDGAVVVLEKLEQHHGMLPYNYKSDPQQIQAFFAMSKKEFKRALTQLSTQGSITITESGIYQQK